MKILLAHDLYKPALNGVVTSMVALYEGLKALGHDVKILTLSQNWHTSVDDELYEARSMPAGFIYPGVRASLATRNKIVKELIAWNPDVIHTQSEFFTYRMAKYISKKCNAPIVHTYHTDYEYYIRYVQPIRRLDQPLSRGFLQNRMQSAKHIIVPSEKSKEQLRNFGLGGQISVIPTSLPGPKAILTEEEGATLRKQLGIPKTAPIILFLGRIAEEKNIQELLPMHKELLKEMPDAYFLLVGDGPYRKTLEKLVDKIATNDRVIFTGAVPNLDVWKYYQVSNVFVNASSSETQGLTFFEALSNGLPVVCRYDSCLEGMEGNLFFFNDAADFSELIKKAIEKKQSPGALSNTEIEFAQKVLEIYERYV